MKYDQKTRIFERLGVLGVALGLCVFVIIPLVVLGLRSVVDPQGGWTFGAFQDVFGDGAVWGFLGTSLTIALGTSACATVLGVGSAWLLVRSDVPGQKALNALLALPYAIPPYVSAVGWIALLNPRSGVINRIWMSFTGGTDPLINMYSIFGVIGVLALAYYPLVMLQTSAALENMDPSLEESARMSGASPWRVWVDVTFPLILPSIASSALLVMMIGLASFGVPYLIGSPGRVEVLTTAIYSAIDLGTDAALARAVVMAVMLASVAACAMFAGRILVKKGRALVGSKASRASRVALGPWKPVAACGLWLLVCVAVGLPVLTLIVTSLMTSWGAGLTWDNIGLVNYKAVFADSRTLGALGMSVGLALTCATLVVTVGLLVSTIRQRSRVRGRSALAFLSELPYALPGTVLAFGLILTFSQPIWVGLGGSLWFGLVLFNTAFILLIAYSVKYLAFGVRASDAALTQIDGTLEEAARMSGAGPVRAWWDVVVPLVRPAMAAAWVLVFLPAMSEVTMSVLLFGPETRTLGVLLFEFLAYEDPPRAAVLGALMVSVIVVCRWIFVDRRKA